ncbi:MAG TPA: histidine kinase dimerization/phosphoacceptor domain-containing protein, partial [Gaiellaceae bacterium]|nr:histidine kinase dimerization/phosphoacceptor domain-containing protein [Gaiellaceae bacterium]
MRGVPVTSCTCVLRLGRLVLGGALVCAGVTAAFALVAKLEFAYRNPELHTALETASALTALGAAFLLLGRFGRTGYLDEILLSAGLTVLAGSSLALVALPAALNLGLSRGAFWAMLATGIFAAALIATASLLPRLRLGQGPGWPLVVYGGALSVAAALFVVLVVHQRHLPNGVRAVVDAEGSGARLVDHPALLAVQIVQAQLYLLAAYGFTRRHRLTGDEFRGWLAFACVLAAAAQVNYSVYPPFPSTAVYAGDLFRLGFYLVLLCGAGREISSYWSSAVAAAALEERRRLARDVHDGLAQEIAFIGRNLRLLRQRGMDSELLDRILQGVERAQEESRRVVGALSWRIDQPLDQALAVAARDAARRHGAAVDLELEPGVVLSPHEREAVVRIAAEAVANAARH